MDELMSEETYNVNCIYGTVELRSGFDEQGRGWGRRIERDRNGNVVSDKTEFTGCRVANFKEAGFAIVDGELVRDENSNPRTFWLRLKGWMSL